MVSTYTFSVGHESVLSLPRSLVKRIDAQHDPVSNDVNLVTITLRSGNTIVLIDDYASDFWSMLVKEGKKQVTKLYSFT